MLAGVALGMLAYSGYGGAVVFSEETLGRRRGVARAVLGVLDVAVVAELLAIAAALLGAPSLAQLATAPAPMSYLVRSLGGDRLVTVITLVLVAAIFNAPLAALLDFARAAVSARTPAGLRPKAPRWRSCSARSWTASPSRSCSASPSSRAG